jgi:hypothetical protein
MKRWILWFVIVALFIGFLSTTSCKRSKVEDPNMTGPAGFRIILSGTANPSTIYVPESGTPAEPCIITVIAKDNQGNNVDNKDVIFQEGGYGYFEGNQISAVEKTVNGIADMKYYISSTVNINTTVTTYITVTLVDDGRLDSTLAQIRDDIPVIIIPYKTEGVIIHGHIRTPAGNGVGEVAVELLGTDGHASDVTVTRPSGSYEFFVIAGWYGIITPSKEGYSFVPADYTFTDLNPVILDIMNLDFTAVLIAGNNLAVDITTWDVGPEGDTQVINVYNSTGDSSISYLVVPNADWITVTPSSGSTPGSFTILVDENQTGEDRDSTITVVPTDAQGSEVTITVNQSSTEVSSDATLEARPRDVSVGGEGLVEDDAVTINVYNSTTDEPIEYLITVRSKDINWLHVTEDAGTTDDSFGVYADANIEEDGAARTGEIKLIPTSTGVSNQEVTIIVNQEAGARIEVSPETVTASAAGNESFTIDVYNANYPDNTEVLTWDITNDETWIKITPTTGQTGETFTVTVQGPNPTSAVRSGVITVTADNGTVAYVTVYQNGS